MDQQLYSQPKRLRFTRGTGFKAGGNFKGYFIGFLLVVAGINLVVILMANLFSFIGR